MLGYKVWWLNRDKQLREGQGEHEKEKKNVWSLPQLFLSETVAREVNSSAGNSFFFNGHTDPEESENAGESRKERGGAAISVSPSSLPILPPVLSLDTDSLRTSPLLDCWINPGKTDSFFKQNAFSFLCWNVIIAILSVIVWKQLDNMLWLRGDDSGILETFSFPTSSTGILVT